MEQPEPVAKRFGAPTPVRNEVCRTRVLDALADQMPRIILVHSPAGYGKSTLASQWLTRLHDHGYGISWLGLDSDDNNPIWFLRHLVEAVGQAGPPLDPRVRVTLEERPHDAERYVLPTLINAIDNHARPVAIALDDLHLVDGERSLQILGWLLEHGSEYLRIIITSRTKVGLSAARLKLSGELAEVDHAALRFDSDELDTFLVHTSGSDLSAAARAALLDSTAGWAAALQLVALNLESDADATQLVQQLSGRHSMIAEYLTESVLDTLPPNVLELVLRSSVTERLNASLVSELVDADHGQEILDNIVARNLFLQPLDDQGEWYRYHHLFAEFLQRRLDRDHPGLRTQLHIRAAHWFHNNGYDSEAVGQAIAGGDQALAVEMVRNNAMVMVEHSRMSSLLALCEKLPGPQLRDDPLLQLALAWANCLLHRATDAQICLDRVLRTIDRTHRSTPSNERRDVLVRIECQVVQACIDMYADDVSRVDVMEATCFSRADQLRPWVVSVAANIATFHRLHTFRLDQALSIQHGARPYHDATTGPFSVVYGYLYESLAHRSRLEIIEARECAVRAHTVAIERAGSTSHAARLAGAVLAELDFAAGQDANVVALTEAARELGSEGGVADFMMATYATLARARCHNGDHDQAATVLDEAEQIARNLRLPRLQVRVGLERRLLSLQQTAETVDLDVVDTFGPGAQTKIFSQLSQAWDVASAALSGRASAPEIDRAAEGLEKLAVRADRANLVLESTRCRLLAGNLRRLETDGAEGPRVDYRLGRDAGYFTPQPVLASRPPHRDSRDQTQLSAREFEILELLDLGLTNREIAQRTFLGVNTVKWHLKRIYAKLGARHRHECLSIARERQLVVMPRQVVQAADWR